MTPPSGATLAPLGAVMQAMGNPTLQVINLSN
jgi:hypothetical protein